MAATKKAKLATESDKNKRYDRQLRLWGDHGQATLESAHVCVINASALGTEILKSLILPGIGAFTIVDPHKTTGEDAGNNFFLDSASIGKSRAKTALKYLLELNQEVRGDVEELSVENLLQERPTFFQQFTIVVATALHEKTLLDLAEKLWQDQIPLVVCRAYGMIGYMRIQTNEHTVIESHPDNEFHDLRLDAPFPTLLEFCNSVDLESMSHKDHSHVPFVILLLKCLNIWKAENGGKIPKTGAEKKLFKEKLIEGMRPNSDGSNEENFDEAVRAVNRSICITDVPSDVKELFENPSVRNLNCESSPFWVLVEALRIFTEKKGNLPVSGIIPDMTADTERYIALQKIYRTEAEKDAQEIFSLVQILLSQHGKCLDCISENDVRLFCKNARNLRVIQGRSLAEEYNRSNPKIRDYVVSLGDDDNDCIIFYMMLRAVDRFQRMYNRYPGISNEELDIDISSLKIGLYHLTQGWGCRDVSKDDHVHEMCRFGASEVHTIAAFIGGCAAQEVIKLITGQYVPLNNTFIYNAMNSTSSVFVL